MNRLLVLAALIFSSTAWAKTDPCTARSRHIALAKNCYSGEMAKDGAQKFFTFTNGPKAEARYCFNSLVELEQKSGQVKINVLRETKDVAQAYSFTIHADEFKKTKKALLNLKGLTGKCFSPTGDRETCDGGILKTLGFKDTALPMILAVGKNGNTLSVDHLAFDAKEIEAGAPRELNGMVSNDTSAFTQHIVNDVHRRLTQMGAAKAAAARSGKTSPKKMAEASEQFRFCQMAFEGFIKNQKLTDPFTPAEHETMNYLISYMNNDPHFESVSRLPASSTPVVGRGK